MAEEALSRALSSVKANPVLTGLVATAIVGVAWTVNDFLVWKAFGTGGTPPTWAGYYRMTKIRIKHNLSNNDLLDPSPLSTTGPSYLKSPLPKREGPRPKIRAHTMPQRQEPAPLDAATRERLQTLVSTLATEHPSLFEVRPSHTEGKTTEGLYARKDLTSLNPIARDRLLDHEIAHAHPADNSLHVWLSDPDARQVVESGWGQRFPLTFVKSGWTMVYAPRNAEELKVVERIVRAAGGWITGVQI